ncbi:MAG: CHAT domain-containing protein [Anaerolineales bacterium]|nr:CHAT domain-containing protein [Anaerolineales bacterium]
MPHPQLIITIKRIGDAARHEYEATLIRADNSAEICVNTFTYRPDLLIDMEPQWMLDKAVPRRIDDVLRSGQTAADFAAEQAQKLAEYGRRLYSFLFGDGQDLQNFLKFNDAYAKSAHLTLSLHGNAAVLWRLPWEYIHDGQDFLALHGKFQLSRRPHELGRLAPDPVQLPLRLLVIVSSPEDQAELNTEKELSAIQEALDEAERHGLIQTEYLEDATLAEIGATLKNFNPHVLHYTGHGVFLPDRDKPENGRSYLALEKDNGQTLLAGIKELRPHLQNAPDLRLALLSGCQTAQTSDSDAFSGVATGMLHAGIPAVAAMQFSILDNSGIQLARAFYTALAQGDSLAAAMQATRIALWQFEDGPGYDWGIPALYLRAQELILVDQTSVGTVRATPHPMPSTLINVGGLPLPRHFVGRKQERRQLRNALDDNRTKSAFVRGIGGMGKSSLAAKLAQRPGTDLDDILIIRCHEVDPLDIPGKLASFLQAQGVAGHADAGNLLLNPTLDPTERAQRAAQLVANRRYLIVFDNFESVLDLDEPGATHLGGASHLTAYEVADENLRGLLRGLLTANWRSLCLFTGRFRWQGYDEVVRQEIGLEIHLPELTAPQTMMLMNNLSRLRQETRQVKIAMYKKVGGHPKTIELLNGWLKDGSVSDLLNDERLDGLLTAEWEEYFLKRLLGKLNEAERTALTRLAIFQTKLGDEELDYAGVDETMVRRWLDLSLLQWERGTVQPPPPQLAELLPTLPQVEQEKVRQQQQTSDSYTVHPVVADYLLAQTSDEERRTLHRWAATFYGRPFVELARNFLAQNDRNTTYEEAKTFARHDQLGVVRYLVAQTDDMEQARRAMARALDWQRHLSAAGEVKAADDIIRSTWRILALWGELDRAKGLLRWSIESLTSINKSVAEMNYATLLAQEGKLNEALKIYQRVHEIFIKFEAIQNAATVLELQATTLEQLGDLDNAISIQEKSLSLKKKINFDEGQAISLHHLAMLHDMKGEYETALSRSEAAEELARKIKNEFILSATLHEQGIIYINMAKKSLTEKKGVKLFQTAVTRFEKSINISRRIGYVDLTASTLNELGKLHRDVGQINEAIVNFNDALESFRRLGNPVKVSHSLLHLASIHEQQSQYTAALAKYKEAKTLLQQYGSPQDIAIVENHIARVHAKMRGG